MLGPRAHTRRLFLVHSDQATRAAIAHQATALGYVVREACSLAEAGDVLRAKPLFTTALLGRSDAYGRLHADSTLPVDWVRVVRRLSPETQVVLLVDPNTGITDCCEAVTAGVVGFLEVVNGEIDRDALAHRLDQAEQSYRRRQAELSKFRSGEIFENTGFVGRSAPLAKMLSQAVRAAQVSDAPVLIYGETGTGKQMLAEVIHRLDPKRSSAPFLTINCAAITGTLAESALFGHLRGAFTGSTGPRAGYFRAADGGVILLDEIGELDLALQPKLLRVLQEGLVMPVGSDVEYAVDVRVVAATNRRLPALVQEKRFRLDLYQRLDVITLEIPPLRERPDDIPSLVQFFVEKYSKYYQGEVVGVDPQVYDALAQCAMEGNVRELENIVRRALAFKEGGNVLELIDLPPSLFSDRGRSAASAELPREVIDAARRMIERGTLSLEDFVGQCEQSLLAELVNRKQSSYADLARRLSISRRTLYNKLQRYGL